MSTDVIHRTTCRLCDGSKLELVVPFVATPEGDGFVGKDKLNEKQRTYPLDLYFCHGCTSLQMLDVVDPNILFRNYTYKSGTSAGIVKHFSEYTELIIDRFKPEPGSLVIDIGSNDGGFLSHFKKRGHKVLGVDASQEISREANQNGIETIASFFTTKVAADILKSHGKASIVTANNVFAHADDMQEILNGIHHLMAPDGIFAFEVSYVVDVVDKMLLGAIFHEHLCHHAVLPLKLFLEKHSLELIDVERVTIQGGSIICIAQHKGGKRPISPRVAELIGAEKERGFHSPKVYREFADRISALRESVRTLLQEFKSSGKRMAGFGAARGGTTLMYHFGLGDFLEFIVDDNTEKHGLYSPGLHLPVLPVSEVYERGTDYLFLLAWVHAKPILEKHKKFLEKGGHFIIAHPKLEVI